MLEEGRIYLAPTLRVFPSLVGKERMMNVLARLFPPPFFFKQFGTQAQEMVLPTFRVDLPTSVIIVKIIPHRCVWGLVS